MPSSDMMIDSELKDGTRESKSNLLRPVVEKLL